MKQMNDEMIERAAETLRAIADPTRIRIMMRLRAGESNVSGLSQALRIGQPTVSKHLSALRKTGIVKVRRDGVQAIYSIKDDAVFGICDIVCASVRRNHQEVSRLLEIPKTIGKARRKTSRS